MAGRPKLGQTTLAELSNFTVKYFSALTAIGDQVDSTQVAELKILLLNTFPRFLPKGTKKTLLK